MNSTQSPEGTAHRIAAYARNIFRRTPEIEGVTAIVTRVTTADYGEGLRYGNGGPRKYAVLNEGGYVSSQMSKRKLHTKSEGIAFAGRMADLDRAALFTVDYALAYGDGVVEVRGPEAYRLSIWAHCRIMNVAVVNYMPANMDRDGPSFKYIEELKGRYRVECRPLRPFREPGGFATPLSIYREQYRNRLLNSIVF